MSESQLFRYKSRESSKKIQLAQNTKCNNLLSELDEVEIYEWGHLKLLKVNRLLKRKKIQEVIDFLKEVIIGIECKTSDLNNEFPNRMKNRILEEIKLPAMKKLRNIFVNDKKYQDAFEISKKILEVENTEDNRNIKISLYRVLEDKNHETNNFLKDNMVIDINSFSNLPKNEDDNEINDKSTLHASEEERILRYNDEFEDMKYLGMLKYLIYPMKQGVKKISSVIFCCKKRKGRLAQQKENN